MLHALARERSDAAGLVAARRAQPRRARLRRRGRRAARRAPRRPPPRRLQPPGAADAHGADYDVAGRLDLAVLERAGVPKDADHYLCGPDAFMRDIGAALTARGVAPERVATEAFGAVAVHASGIVKAGDRAPHAPDGPPGAGPTVTFARSASPSLGTTAIRACSTSPKRATSRSGSAAASASATTARAACSPATSPTTPTRSSRRPTAGCSSAAPGRRPSSRSTSEAGERGPQPGGSRGCREPARDEHAGYDEALAAMICGW